MIAHCLDRMDLGQACIALGQAPARSRAGIGDLGRGMIDHCLDRIDLGQARIDLGQAPARSRAGIGDFWEGIPDLPLNMVNCSCPLLKFLLLRNQFYYTRAKQIYLVSRSCCR
jgi:hypothetical protein